MKQNKGITLITLIMYIILTLVVLGILECYLEILDQT